MKVMNTAARWLYALMETVLLYVALLYLLGAVFGLPWRTWIGDAAWARAMPSALTGLCLLALIRLTSARYALPQPRSQQLGPRAMTWGFVAISLGTAPIALFLCINRFAPPETLELITISPLLASLVNVLRIALVEEFVYRYVLMGRLIRAGVPMAIVVVLQAGLFVAAHGKQAFVSQSTLVWYLVGALTLGTLYAATRSITASVALHTLVDVCIALTDPSSYWLTQRPIDAVSGDWTGLAATVWSAALLVYGFHAIWHRRARLFTAQGHPDRGRDRPSYNRPPWMTPSPLRRRPRSPNTPPLGAGERSANSPMN